MQHDTDTTTLTSTGMAALAAFVLIPATATTASDGPEITVEGVNAVQPHEERRMSRDIEGKLDDHRRRLGNCLAGTDESTVTVDWTITTDGEPVDVTVFSSSDSVESCVSAAVAELRYAHLEDRHPRARVALKR